MRGPPGDSGCHVIFGGVCSYVFVCWLHVSRNLESFPTESLLCREEKMGWKKPSLRFLALLPFKIDI